MKRLILIICTMVVVSILGWIIDNVFGRTLHPGHGSITTPSRTMVVKWDGTKSFLTRTQLDEL